MKRRGEKKEKKNLKLSTLVSLGVTDQSLPLCFQIVFLGATVFTGKHSEVYFLLHSYLITPQKHLCVHGAPPVPPSTPPDDLCAAAAAVAAAAALLQTSSASSWAGI